MTILGQMLMEDGIVIGRKYINQLYRKLKEDGRTEDWERAIEDDEYQLELLKEYGIYTPNPLRDLI